MMQNHPFENESVNLLDDATPLDDRTKLSPAARERLAAKGLKFEVPPDPLVVVMMDPIMHTGAFMTCADPDCICHGLEYERHLAEHEAAKPQRPRRRKVLVNRSFEPPRGDLAPGSRPFSILK